MRIILRKPKQKNYILLLLVFILASFFAYQRINLLEDTNQSLSLNDCSINKYTQQKCLEQTTKRLVQKEGVQIAIDKVIDWKNSPFATEASCHGLSHVIGKEAYKLFNSHKNFSVEANPRFCAFGFYHGFMEALFSRTTDPKEAIVFCDYLNEKFTKQGIESEGACFHGIGHGIIDIHNTPSEKKVIESLTKGITTCKKISSNSERLRGCLEGAFNGIESYYLEGPGWKEKFDNHNPYKLCKRFDEEYPACYHFMTDLVFFKTRNLVTSRDIIFEQINNNLLPLQFQNIAFESLAYSVGRDHVGNNFKEYQTFCSNLPEKYIPSCIQGFINGLDTSRQSTLEYPYPIMFCKTPLFNHENKNHCYMKAVGILKKYFEKKTLTDFCEKIETGYESLCN